MAKLGDSEDIYTKTFTSHPLLDRELIEKIRLGHDIEDIEFDWIFPPYYQFQSAIHWSSIKVARQISDWIRPLNKKSVIDIGCGVGKLCLLLRILTDYEIFGIEQRAKLAEIANKIIRVNDFKRISIAAMNMLELNWDLYDIYYLYNPFQEHVQYEGVFVIENDIELDAKNFAHYTSEVFRQLSWATPGKVLITFHGYGGSIPRSWKMVKSRQIGSGHLTMWIKESP